MSKQLINSSSNNSKNGSSPKYSINKFNNHKRSNSSSKHQSKFTPHKSSTRHRHHWPSNQCRACQPFPSMTPLKFKHNNSNNSKQLSPLPRHS